MDAVRAMVRPAATDVTDIRIQTTDDGAIVHDASLAPQIEPDWFDPDAWQRQGALQGHGGGRAAACFIDTPIGACVLRHYHRGGMFARLLRDRYAWCGAERTRAVAELYLTTELYGRGLPVPVAVAARYRRHGPCYTADIITRRIDPSRTLAQCLAAGELDRPLATTTGHLLAGFHRAGLWHADLNAHNILVAGSDLYVIDFDRSRLRRQASGWQRANLQRLRRSLVKLGAARAGEAPFEAQLWQPLVAAYIQAMNRAV